MTKIHPHRSPNRSKGYDRPELHLPDGQYTLGGCPVCGLFYATDSASDRALHASQHKVVIDILLPTPETRMAHARASGRNPSIVTGTSPAWMQRAMYQRARRFNRETGYGIMWSEIGEKEPGTEGWLIIDDSGLHPSDTIVGAASFRWRKWTDSPPGWALQWIWITPVAQRHGIYGRLLPALAARYGCFDVEAPLSEKMKGAVARYHYPDQTV